jgi:hypothetical protein
MRRIAPVIPLVVLAVLPIALAAAQALAAPAAPGTQPVQPKLPSRPEPRPEIPARVTAVKRTPHRVVSLASMPYTDGPLSLDVEITAGSNPLSTSLVVERVDARADTGIAARVPVSAQPGEKVTVTAVDELGLKKSCEPTEYRLRLDPGGTPRRLMIKPTCSFSTEAVDPSASVGAEARRAQGNVSYRDASFSPSTLTCGMPFETKALVRNDGTQAQAGVRLVLETPAEPALSAPFDLAPGRESRQSVQIAFSGLVGDYTLRVDASGTTTFQPRWRVNVMRSCELAFALD